MSTRHFLLLLVCGLSLSACSTTEVSRSSKAAIRVTIPYDSDDRLEAFGYRHHDKFHVLLTNASRTPLRVWQQWCSWGYDCLQIEVVEKDGTKHLLKKKRVPFYANFPDYVVLQPDQSSVWDVNLREASEWTDLSWFPKDKMVNAKVRAIFTVPKPTAEGDRLSGADRLGVWTGRVVSDYQDFTLYGPSPKQTN